MKLIFPSSLVAMFLTSILCSCSVDPAYDITEGGIDTSVTLFGDGITVPVGSTTRLLLKDFLDLKTDGTDDSLVRLGEDGCYYVEVSGSSDPFEITVPEITIPSMTIGADDFPRYVFPENIVGQIAPQMFFDEFPVDISTAVSVALEAPDGVRDVLGLVVEAPLTITPNVSFGYVVLKKGFRIEYPSFISLVSYTSGIEVQDGHVMVLTSDIRIGGGTRLEMAITGLDTEGLTYADPSSGKLRIRCESPVRCYGNIGVDGNDFVVVPEYVDSGVSMSVAYVKVKEIDACYDIKADGKPISIHLTGISDAIADTRIVLSRPALETRLDNDSPFRFEAEADISVRYPDESVSSIAIPYTVLDPYSFATFGIERARLSELISRIPEYITLENISAGSDPGTRVHIAAGEVYSMTANYVFHAPLAFGSGTEFRFDTTLTGLGISIPDLVSRVALSFDLVSTIPFDATISAEAVDRNGNPLKGVRLSADESIAAGAPDAESISPIELSFECDGSVATIDDVKLVFSIAVPSTREDIPLREDMYIMLDNIKAELPAGIRYNR